MSVRALSPQGIITYGLEKGLNTLRLYDLRNTASCVSALGFQQSSCPLGAGHYVNDTFIAPQGKRVLGTTILNTSEFQPIFGWKSTDAIIDLSVAKETEEDRDDNDGMSVYIQTVRSLNRWRSFTNLHTGCESLPLQTGNNVFAFAYHEGVMALAYEKVLCIHDFHDGKKVEVTTPRPARVVALRRQYVAVSTWDKSFSIFHYPTKTTQSWNTHERVNGFHWMSDTRLMVFTMAYTYVIVNVKSSSIERWSGDNDLSGVSSVSTCVASSNVFYTSDQQQRTFRMDLRSPKAQTIVSSPKHRTRRSYSC